MNKTKSTTQSAHSTIKPISISTTTKFQKLQQVNNIVHQISQKQQNINDHNNQKMITNTRQIKAGTSQKVLQLLKTRIKTNYDQLYNNYGDNKQKIIKQIQAVQTNIAGQNAMNTKFDDIIKQKAKHDKLKSQVQAKQKKLKKYNDIKQQLINQSISKTQRDSNSTQIQKMISLQERKMDIQHQSAILQDMLKNRKKIHLNLLQKYNKLFEQTQKKKDRKQKIHIQNLKKQKMLKILQQKLFKDQQIQIPTSLAQQLSQKIQIYQNKHSYNNIIQHQTILQQQRYRKLKQQTQTQRQLQRQRARKRQTQQKNQLQQLYNIYLIKNMQLQKIKKLCAADSIEAIIGSDGSLDSKNLEQIKKQIQKKIDEQQTITNTLESNIQAYLNHEDVQNNINTQNLLQQIQQQKKKIMLLKLQCNKKQELSNEWNIILDLMKVKSSKQDLDGLLNSLETEYIRSQGNAKSSQSHKTKLMNQMIQEYQKEETY